MNYFITYTIYVLILSVLLGVSSWKMFKKMGYNPLLAFIPFYNYYIILKETNHSKWWAIMSYLPIVGTILMSVFHLFLMKKMGKKSTLDKVLTVILPFIYMAYVNYTQTLGEEEEEFLLPGEEKEEEKKETFLGSVVFAIVFATIIHTFIAQPFGIPTGSMENTLKVGDFLFVNKLNYGFRMPTRPLAIPFLQGTIFDTGEKNNPKDDPKSYVEAVDLPYFRFPGWEKVKRNDIVVFNYPEDSVHTAIDRKDAYVKRCVAVAGDKIEFRKGKLFINGEPEKRMGDAEVQHAYIATTETQINVPAIYDQFGFLPLTEESTNTGYAYIFQGLTDALAKEIGQLPEVIDIKEVIDEPITEPQIEYYPVKVNGQLVNDGTDHALMSNKVNTSNTIFPINKPWNADNYGPLDIPKKGQVVTLTQDNLPTYKRIIENYEGNSFEEKDGNFFINGKETNQYTIKYDYYMMIGDNRDASLDSRYFGFVPETHIVGKPMFTWMSIEGLFANAQSTYQANGKKIRWDRMFKATNTGEKNKTSYWWIAVAILVLFFGWDFFRNLLKKKEK
ncbi:MAG: signal peptidase I [Flavobacteriales bacterium]|nr:MAG: signal peptidase I [Flavobacteriales bacterium]